MNEIIAQLVLPYIEPDRRWLDVVTAVSKSFVRELDQDSNWEQRFRFACGDFFRPSARFRLLRYVECKHTMAHIYDPTISQRFSINLLLDPSGPSRARQLFRQFFHVEECFADLFPEDDLPSAEFTVDTPIVEDSTDKAICGQAHHAGDIFINIVTNGSDLVVGNLETLYCELVTFTGYDSDELYECSECGAEQHSLF